MLRGETKYPSPHTTIDKRTVKNNETQKKKVEILKTLYSFKTLTSGTIRHHIQISSFFKKKKV